MHNTEAQNKGPRGERKLFPNPTLDSLGFIPEILRVSASLSAREREREAGVLLRWVCSHPVAVAIIVDVVVSASAFANTQKARGGADVLKLASERRRRLANNRESERALGKHGELARQQASGREIKLNSLPLFSVPSEKENQVNDHVFSFV